MPWGATIDGSPFGLLRRPLVSIEARAWNKVPLLIGTNQDEGTMFVPLLPLMAPGLHFPLQVRARPAHVYHHRLASCFSLIDMLYLSFSLVRCAHRCAAPIQEADFNPMLQHLFGQNASLLAAIAKQYASDGTATPAQRAAAVLRDWMFACPARRVVRALSAQNAPAYLYHFSYLPNFPDYKLLGTYHGSEIIFVLDNQWPLGLHFFSPADQKMADVFRHYWTNFATNLSPNAAPGTTTVWPQYSTAADQNIVLQVRYVCVIFCASESSLVC